MKKILLFSVLLVSVLVSLCGCRYEPPEGYTKEPHTYEQVLAYARAIDPNAEVTEKYFDSEDEYGYKYREWPAVINGTECFVASCHTRVWNTGFMAGEFARMYYRLDTDYDHITMSKILAERSPGWKMKYTDISGRYHNNDIASVEIVLPEYRELGEEELEEVWNTAKSLRDEYVKYPVRKEAWFSIQSPGKYYSYFEKEYIVKKDSRTYITDFSEEGKLEFFEEYRGNWALLESGFPIED